MQDHPDQSTETMGDGSDGLFMTQSNDQMPIEKLEDAPFTLTEAKQICSLTCTRECQAPPGV